MTILLFDMDGVLTAPRQPMTDHLASVLIELASSYRCYVVTGSDYAKVQEQIPARVRLRLAGVYACAGNEFWSEGEIVSAEQHDFDPALIQTVEEWIAASSFRVRCGTQIERRTGMLNVSVVGRGAPPELRQAYARHDKETGERGLLVEKIDRLFPAYEATCGGQVSVDIAPKGWNKARVAEMLPKSEAVHFFADRVGPGGNDRPLAHALAASSPVNRVSPVTGPEETQSLLEAYYHAGAAA